MTPDRALAARELLAFYLEAGADACIGEAPVDRFADPAPAVAPQPIKESSPEPKPRAPSPVVERPSAPSPSPSAPPAVPEAAVMAAREAAKSAASLDTLRAILERFEGCALKATAKQLVFADGNPRSRIMFVGEAPGRDEDIAGLPFVGRSGKLLDLMLKAIGLDRRCVYIANIVPWRPPANRTPTPAETQICLPFLLRQIDLCDPDVLVCLGNPSTQALLATTEGITRTRGRWFRFQTSAREIRAMPTFHPAFLLRSPLQKRLAWRDFLSIKSALTAQ